MLNGVQHTIFCCESAQDATFIDGPRAGIPAVTHRAAPSQPSKLGACGISIYYWLFETPPSFRGSTLLSGCLNLACTSKSYDRLTSSRDIC